MYPLHPVLNPEILAPAGLCCPSHHRLAISSASLAISHPFPSCAGYRVGLWHSGIILPDRQTFRAFLVRLSRIAAFSFRRGTRCLHCPVLRHRHWPLSRGRNPLASPTLPRISASRGAQFRRLVRSLSLRPSWLLAPWADPTGRLCVPPADRDFYIRAFSLPDRSGHCRI